MSRPLSGTTIVVSVVDAPTIDDPNQAATAFVRRNLEGAGNLAMALTAAISQLEEHANS